LQEYATHKQRILELQTESARRDVEVRRQDKQFQTLRAEAMGLCRDIFFIKDFYRLSERVEYEHPEPTYIEDDNERVFYLYTAHQKDTIRSILFDPLLRNMYGYEIPKMQQCETPSDWTRYYYNNLNRDRSTSTLYDPTKDPTGRKSDRHNSANVDQGRSHTHVQTENQRVKESNQSVDHHQHMYTTGGDITEREYMRPMSHAASLELSKAAQSPPLTAVNLWVDGGGSGCSYSGVECELTKSKPHSRSRLSQTATYVEHHIDLTPSPDINGVTPTPRELQASPFPPLPQSTTQRPRNQYQRYFDEATAFHQIHINKCLAREETTKTDLEAIILAIANMRIQKAQLLDYIGARSMEDLPFIIPRALRSSRQRGSVDLRFEYRSGERSPPMTRTLRHSTYKSAGLREEFISSNPSPAKQVYE
jgi:hypothetical protein